MEVDLLLIAVVKLSFVTCGAKTVLSHFFNDAFCFAEMFDFNVVEYVNP